MDDALRQAFDRIYSLNNSSLQAQGGTVTISGSFIVNGNNATRLVYQGGQLISWS